MNTQLGWLGRLYYWTLLDTYYIRPLYQASATTTQSIKTKTGWLLADQWEGLTQASQLQGLAMTTNCQPPPSVEDQLCRGRMVVLCHNL